MSGFTANGTGVKLPNGKPLCVTVHSAHLDADSEGVVESYKKREAWAIIIAKALNVYFSNKRSNQP